MLTIVLEKLENAFGNVRKCLEIFENALEVLENPMETNVWNFWNFFGNALEIIENVLEISTKYLGIWDTISWSD